MQRQQTANWIVGGLVVLTVGLLLVQQFRRWPNEVNLHDGQAVRIEAFELRPGDVGVTIRVRHGNQPVSAATVWEEPSSYGDEDTGDEPLRKGVTDREGLVRVPVRKGSGQTHLFVRDAAGRVGGGTLTGTQVLSAPDVVLADVAPLTGRIVTADGVPIAGAVLRIESFSSTRPPVDGPAIYIRVPSPVQPEYTVRSGSDGQFTLPGVPVGYDCDLDFSTTGYGEGHLWLPHKSPREVRLAPAGSVGVRVSGEGSAGDMARLRCYLSSSSMLTRKPDEVHVDGRQTRRHDGREIFLIGNVVPGEYEVRLEATPRSRSMPDKAAQVTVTSRAVAETSVPLKQAGQVTGRAVDGASGAAIKGVRVGLFTAPGADVGGYGGSVTTDGRGNFTAYVPAGVPVALNLSRAPAGYSLPRGPLAMSFDVKPVIAAKGESKAFPDIKLYRQGSISGEVVADNKPVPGAVVDVAWDATQARSSKSVVTNASGRFQIANAPPGQPALVRVRAGGMVNAKVTFQTAELVAPLNIPISSANAFRIRGQVKDGRGQPLQRAKVVISSALRPDLSQLKVNQNPESKDKVAAPTLNYVQPAEVEAVFTDAGGKFESGPLWPGCVYTLRVSADGLVVRHLREIEGRLGEVHEVASVQLQSMSAQVAGTVVGTDGRPLAGATVINSGDGPKRLTATTDGAGRFKLSGLYDGPAIIVAHKPGFRWGFTTVSSNDEAAKIVLRALTEPPAAIAPLSDEHRQAESALVKKLTEVAEQQKAKLPRSTAADPWAEARKDIDAYLTKLSKTPTSHTGFLLPLARELAKEDKDKALRVLREAAAAAKRLTIPEQPGAGGFLAMTMAGSFNDTLRVMELIRVAAVAADLGAIEEARSSLMDAEKLLQKLPDLQRQQPLTQSAGVWISVDPPRAEKVLDALKPYSFNFDLAIGGIIERLLKDSPEKAVPWLARFKEPKTAFSDRYRSVVAVRLAKSDLPKALRLAEEITEPAFRASTLSFLVTVAQRTDQKLAHELIEKAAEAVVTLPSKSENDPDTEDARAGRLGVAIHLLWQADAAKYADTASLIAIAMTTRPPVPAHENATQTWRSQTFQLAAGVASVDPATARALLARHREPESSDDSETYIWTLAQALANPATAARYVDAQRGKYYATDLLEILRRRSAVIDRLDSGHVLGWLRADNESPFRE